MSSVRIVAVTLIAWALMAWSSVSLAAPGYRLAGILAAGPDYLGLLEVPQGGQVLVRKGSELPDGARVAALTERQLDLLLPSGQRLSLMLSGLANKPVLAATANQPVAPANAPDVVKTKKRTSDRALVRTVREVEVRPFRQALHAPVESIDKGTSAMAPDSAAVTQRFAQLLDLPPGARIVEIDGQPVKNAAAVVTRTERALASGTVAVVNVQSDQGFERIYLMPETARP
jgi:hypothetical protein